MDFTQQIKEAKSEKEKYDLFISNPFTPVDYPRLTYDELCIDVKAGRRLKWFSKRLQTPEICEIAIGINGENLRDVSKRFITEELCYKAVATSPYAIRYVPDQFCDKDLIEYAVKKHARAFIWIKDQKQVTFELCVLAVEKDGSLLRYVPSKYKKHSELLKAAIKSNGLALQFIPKSIRTKALCFEAVKQNPLSLEFVPDGIKTDALCNDAVSRDAFSIQFVPDDLKNDSLYSMALNNCGAVLVYAPEQYYTKENVIRAYQSLLADHNNSDNKFEEERECAERLNTIFRNISDSLHSDSKIIALERLLGLRVVVRKYYSTSNHLFHVIEEKSHLSFSDFDSFYRYLNGDMNGADLRGFCFDNINSTKYSFDGAILKAADEMRLIKPDYGLYNKIKAKAKNASFLQTKTNEIVKPEAVLHELSIVNNKDQIRKFYYISDIHITHKIAQKNPKQSSELAIKRYIDSKVRQMVQSAPERKREDYLLIAGDVSFDYHISEIFYRSLVRYWNPSSIIVVLGNHELWDCSEINEGDKVGFVVSKYKALFNELKITFLHNGIFTESGRLPFTKKKIYSCEELIDAKPVEIEDYCSRSSIIVLGGIGFSGYNQKFNASQGIYQQSIQSNEEDLYQTQLFEKLYKKIDSALWDRTVIVLTHMPMENWSKEELNPNWIYVSGHTHYNNFCCNEEKTFYADNQIGYRNANLTLKWFYTKKTYGAFDYYQDGIYPISRTEYTDYIHARGIAMNYNNPDGQILMLKRDGYFCFLLKSSSGGLYFLSGGKALVLEKQNESYYYDEMALYGAFVKKVFSGYTNALNQISSVIKELGGSGEIHGAIVDVDFMNHVHLNPVDGKVTYYYATSMVDKYVYPSFQSMLESQRPDMYKKFDQLLKQADKTAGSLQIRSEEAGLPDFILHVTDTSIYGPSRRLRAFQYLTEQNIIRIWDKDLIALMREDLKTQEEYLLADSGAENHKD